MRYLKSAAVAAFVVAVPLFLISTNVRWVINAPVLYSYGFEKYDIPYWTGIERQELISAGRQIRDYFNNDAELLDLRVEVAGVTRSIYNDREVAHMQDVKGLVQGVYRVQELIAAYILVFIAVGFWSAGRRFLFTLGRYAGIGGASTVALMLVVGLGSLVEFDRLFLAFHIVSFSNDLWQLDPSRDYLIAMFPEGFFFDATMLVGLSTVAEAVLMTLVPLYFFWWLPRRTNRREVTAPIPEPST